MRAGTADLSRPGAAIGAGRFPAIDLAAGEDIELENASLVQALVEIPNTTVLDLLPPALGPTNPACMTLTVVSGVTRRGAALRIGQIRLLSRQGARSRGLLIASTVTGDDAAIAQLSRHWAFPDTRGEVIVRDGHDRVEAEVKGADHGFRFSVLRPSAVAPGDCTWITSLHPAVEEGGGPMALVQVELEYRIDRAARGNVQLDSFKAPEWTKGRLRPMGAVQGLHYHAGVRLKPVRFLLDPVTGAGRAVPKAARA